MTAPQSLRSFRGELLRGGEWRGHDFRGQRVGILAAGREAAHIVPAVSRTARAVKLFEEEPDWVVPCRLPLPAGVEHVGARLYLWLAVRDAWTRRLLTPARDTTRRPVTGPGFYPALQRPHCTLITWPVYAVVAQGVRSAEGIEHRVDCLVVGETSALAGEPGTSAPQREEQYA